MWGSAQGTGGDTSIMNAFEQYRQAGAAARAMLVAAAADLWKVPADSVQVKAGVLSHANGRKASFGELADAAARQPVPASVKLKDARDFVFIGKQVPRTDSKAKSNGSARFTQDVKLPGMLTAVVLHPPRFGQKVNKVDSSAVTGIPGVRFVVEIPNGVAVIATTFWAAKKGRDALKVDWDEAHRLQGLVGRADGGVQADRHHSRQAGAQRRRRRQGVGRRREEVRGRVRIPVPRARGDGAHELRGQAHARIVRDLEWRAGPDDRPDGDRQGDGPAAFADQAQHALRGGSFGRRASSASDYVLEAVSIAISLVKSDKVGIPVKLVWTREDDMKGGYYRPMYVHAVRTGLDAAGNVTAGTIASSASRSSSAPRSSRRWSRTASTSTSVEGASTLPYAIA